MNLKELWSQTNLEERRKLLQTMLDAIYFDTKNSKSIIAIEPKPPFRPIFQVAASRAKPGIKIINGPLDTESRSPVVFLVEAGESRTPRPRKATQNILQA